MTLEKYQKKRDFTRTPEPRGKSSSNDRRRFVVQEHHARSLHYDFRLEMGGVLKSWAIPKGPSMNPRDKRLAVEVEDHPVDYIDFQGEISEGNYGAGQVAIWDTGTYELLDAGDPIEVYEDGKLTFVLDGDKLQGQFSLIKMTYRKNQWLLLKKNDESAQAGWELEPRIGDSATAQANGKKPARRTAAKRRPAATRKPRPAPRPQETLHFVSGNTRLDIEHVERAPVPATIEPMLATLVDAPFIDPDWIFEYKWDGVRALCYVENGNMRLVSRNGQEMTMRYPELANIPSSIQAREAVLDGEIVALDENGTPNFQLLQPRVGLLGAEDIQRVAREHPVVYYVFDLLYYDGLDLMPAPLIQRKELLRTILKKNPTLRYSDHVAAQGKELYDEVKAHGLEGIVAKERNSAYVQRRSSRWLKLKTILEQEVVIGGYTQPRGARQLFGALVVGLYREGKLVSVGHVGGGFNRKLLAQLYDLMQPLKSNRSPFSVTPPTNEPVQWVEPKLVCEVKFADWTADGQMRQPIFLGLREDKAPEECVFEIKAKTKQEVEKAESKVAGRRGNSARGAPLTAEQFRQAKDLSGAVQLEVEGLGVPLTHLDKVYWPQEGYTKGDLLRYYLTVAPTLVPYLRDRPLILKRYPNGIGKPFFFQHELTHAPEFMRTQPLESEEGRGINYAIVDNTASLLYLTNLGTIEEHPFSSRVEDLEHPDWIVFDLDPEDADFKTVCEVALATRGVLEGLGLHAYLKTSGSRGMHLFVPIMPRYEYDKVAKFAERIAGLVARENPSCATVERALSKRQAGKVYVDHMQNARGKSVAAPYSVRARPGATVSAPLEWREVEKGLDPQEFTIKTMPKRLQAKGDLFRGVLEQRQSLDKAMAELDKRQDTAERRTRAKREQPPARRTRAR